MLAYKRQTGDKTISLQTKRKGRLEGSGKIEKKNWLISLGVKKVAAECDAFINIDHSNVTFTCQLVGENKEGKTLCKMKSLLNKNLSATKHDR